MQKCNISAILLTDFCKLSINHSPNSHDFFRIFSSPLHPPSYHCSPSSSFLHHPHVSLFIIRARARRTAFQLSHTFRAVFIGGGIERALRYFLQSVGLNSRITVKISKRPISIRIAEVHLATAGNDAYDTGGAN